jgi:hypothetical protein
MVIKPENIDLFCPHCNVMVEARVEASATAESSFLKGEDATEGMHWQQCYDTALCPRCLGPFLIKRRMTFVEGSLFGVEEEGVLFPAEAGMQIDGVPEPIARAYQQAARAYRASLYEPSAIMCRKCLEGICENFKAQGRNLKEKLASLEKEGVIDTKLFQWADELRIVGNDAAHDVNVSILKDDARDALGFVEAILMYVFTLNARFDEFRRRRRDPSNGEGAG